MPLERGPHVVQTRYSSLVEATRLPGDAQGERGEIDEITGGMIAVVPPIGIEYPLDQIRVEEVAEGADVADRGADTDGLAHESDEFGPTDLDSLRLAGTASPATGAPSDLGQAHEVALDVSAQSGWKIIPRGPPQGSLGRRLGKTLRRPAWDGTNAAIPGPCDPSPRRWSRP